MLYQLRLRILENKPVYFEHAALKHEEAYEVVDRLHEPTAVFVVLLV